MERQSELNQLIIDMEVKALEEWNKGNPTGYLNIYAEDISYFDPFQEKRIDGLENMRVFYESLRATFQVHRYEMLYPVVNAKEDMAVLSYNLLSYSNESVTKWNCTEVYRRENDGSWKIIHNHWSLVRPLDK